MKNALILTALALITSQSVMALDSLSCIAQMKALQPKLGAELAPTLVFYSQGALTSAQQSSDKSSLLLNFNTAALNAGGNSTIILDGRGVGLNMNMHMSLGKNGLNKVTVLLEDRVSSKAKMTALSQANELTVLTFQSKEAQLKLSCIVKP